MTATGDLNLSLQGENQKGVLRGNITLQEIKGPSTITVTPFLIPPGINTEAIPHSPHNLVTPWNIDISITTPPEKNSSPPPNASIARIFHPTLLQKPRRLTDPALDSCFDLDSSDPYNTESKYSSTLSDQPSRLSPHESDEISELGAINLHLLGNLFSPTLEGSICLQHLPITFPRTTMSLLQGSCSFDASKPWQPIFQLTASGRLRGKKIMATLSQDQTLQLQSDPFVESTTLALELAYSSSLSPEAEESWLSQLPYWVREQSLTEPTTLFQAVDPKSDRGDLGFTGCGISYQAEVK
jgi:hypothetical protein